MGPERTIGVFEAQLKLLQTYYFNSELANAKQCLKRVITSKCRFPPSAQEVLDSAFSDYNPFCANNRDPGATRKDICHGVRDPSNPPASRTPTTRATIQTITTNARAASSRMKGASSRMEGSVLQVLLCLFLLLMLFVKV